MTLEGRIPPRGWFVTGADTDVGKTHVMMQLLRSRSSGMRWGAYKPVASGALANNPLSDVHRLWTALDANVPLDWICPQVFEAPLAPALAAEREGKTVDLNLIFEGLCFWNGKCDAILVEGAGGLLSPITMTETNADIAKQLGYPLIVVVANRLGAVHQALSTLLSAQHLGLEVDRLILNDVHPMETTVFENHRRLLEMAGQRLLKHLPNIEYFRHGSLPTD